MSIMAMSDRKDDLGQQIEVDEAVVARLPPGATILSASRHGASRWCRSAKIVVALPDGAGVQTYLLRGASGEAGKAMMRGEFESLSAIHNVLASFCPKPLGWGAFKSKAATYYSLSEFHEVVSAQCDPARFTRQLVRLHTRSKSPDGRFGFAATTFAADGDVQNEKLVTDTWEEYFTVTLRRLLVLEEETNGPDDTLHALREALLDRVVPRLLRPLETGPRPLKPSLVHGDLCARNTATVDAGAPMVFAPAACWAHSEFELGQWRQVRNGFDARFLRGYLKLAGISEPAADFDDRNALYALRFNVIASIRFPGSTRYRATVVDELRRLVDKFAPYHDPERPLSPPSTDEEDLLSKGVVVVRTANITSATANNHNNNSITGANGGGAITTTGSTLKRRDKEREKEKNRGLFWGWA